VRVEYFYVYGAFETGERGNDKEWRSKMRKLARQEFGLSNPAPNFLLLDRVLRSHLMS
jgi:hypothetical protein